MTTFLAAMLAAASLIAGAFLLYLTTPHQRLFTAPLPSRTARVAGWAGLGVALAILLTLMGPATAIFTWTVGLMTFWTIVPIAIGWRNYRRGTEA